MALLPGTTNLPSLQLDSNLTVGGTAGVVGASAFTGAATFNGAATFTGAVTFSGTPTLGTGILSPVSRFAAAGTVTTVSGFVDFNVSAAGFAVRLPAPVAGADFTITCHIVPSSGLNTITIPAGGTIFGIAALSGTVAGSVMSFGTAGQSVRIIGLNSTQYQMVNNFGTVVLS